MGGGHSKLRNAFTLIELLAIIVILAIIAVITVPIILNVIDNAKRGSVIDSAYGYKDAVQKFYVEKLAEDTNFKLNGTYTVEALKGMGLTVSGEEPAEGWVKLENNQVVDYSLKFSEWVASYDTDKNSVIASKGDLKEDPSVYFLNNIAQYYDIETWSQPVYYNPVIGGYCNRTENDENGNYILANSAEDYGNFFIGTESNGCMKWYAYSENTDGTVNLLLDHSIDYEYWDNMIWNDDFTDYYYNNKNGPVEALYVLNNRTSHWSENLVRSDKYKAYWNDSAVNLPPNSSFIIDYATYKARLITAEEIASMFEISDFNEHISGSSSLNVVLNGNDLLNVYEGFWTSTPLAGRNDSAVICTGKKLIAFGTADRDIGIRPVITIPE